MVSLEELKRSPAQVGEFIDDIATGLPIHKSDLQVTQDYVERKSS